MTDIAEARRSTIPSAETSVSGLSDSFFEVIRAYAETEDISLRSLYEDAVSEMIQRIARGEDVFFPTVKAGRKYRSRHIRISEDMMSDMCALCLRKSIHRSVFFHRALRDYLSSKGIDLPE